MGRDEGLASSGFSHNFVYGTLALASNTYVQLVDQSQNTTSGAARGPLRQLARRVCGGHSGPQWAASVRPDSTDRRHDPQRYGPTGSRWRSAYAEYAHAGAIRPAGQLDEWTFFERGWSDDDGAGRSRQRRGLRAAAPQLGWVQVRLLDPSGNILATADNTGKRGRHHRHSQRNALAGRRNLQDSGPAPPPATFGHRQLRGHGLGRDAQRVSFEPR